jgi:hypothetical protein
VLNLIAIQRKSQPMAMPDLFRDDSSGTIGELRSSGRI